jgi:hypothetical protein
MPHFHFLPLAFCLLGLTPIVILILVGLFPERASAQTETQHIVNTPWQLTSKLRATFHVRARSRPTTEGFYQGRVGAWADYKIHKRVSVTGGYLFTKLERPVDWEGWNRLYGGVEHEIARWKGTWSARHLAEWFDPSGADNFYRIRHRGGWTTPTRIAPFANIEYLWDEHGWRSTRYLAGTRFRLNDRVSWDVHYFHEPRREDTGRWPRNMWGTTLEVKLGSLAPAGP